MTVRDIYRQAETYKKSPDSPDKWRAYSDFRRQLEILVPTREIDAATRKLLDVMRL